MQRITGTLDSIANFVAWFHRERNKLTSTLTKYVNQVSVLGTVYVAQSLVSEDITPTLMSVLNQMYVCWVLCALGLDATCSDGRTVSQKLQLVSGQALSEDVLKDVEKTFGTESSYLPSIEADNSPVNSVTPDTQHLAVGRLVEFDFNAGVSQNGRPSQVKAYFYVALYPTAIPDTSANDFLMVNYTPTTASRWAAVKAGEISFWKDFVFSRDIVDKERKVLNGSTAGVVAQMMRRQTYGPFRYITGLLLDGRSGMSASHNLSNAMLVFEKQTFDRACREQHVDFNNVAIRDRFFRKTWCMVVVVVDTLMGFIEMYYAGVPSVGKYSFAMINKIGAKGKDSFDLKEVMNAFTAGQSPRF